MSALQRAFLHLPKSTNNWTCKWFLTICYLSFVLMAISAIEVTDTVALGAAGLVVSGLSLGITMGHRKVQKTGCHVCGRC